MSTSIHKSLDELTEEIVSCHVCPRLVEWREKVGSEKRASFRSETYWARPVPGFGDPQARVAIIGLAPAAHGGNRTGRMFTGDRSGDFLFASLYRTGFSNQPTSVSIDDGLTLNDCYMLATVRCAPPDNKPTIQERDNCSAFFKREISLLSNIEVFVALGAYAWDAIFRLFPQTPKPRFAHGAEVELPNGLFVLGTYHPSQQNTFTGRLKPDMLDAVFERTRTLFF